jgi:hypothetical protein
VCVCACVSIINNWLCLLTKAPQTPPAQVTVSDSCRRLIASLLQYDVSARCTWQQFFAHEFLGLTDRDLVAPAYAIPNLVNVPPMPGTAAPDSSGDASAPQTPSTNQSPPGVATEATTAGDSTTQAAATTIATIAATANSDSADEYCCSDRHLGNSDLVFYGTHRTTQQAVAIKVISFESLQTKDSKHWQRHFANELRILQHVKHPNIVSVHQVVVVCAIVRQTDTKRLALMRSIGWLGMGCRMPSAHHARW